MKNKIRMFSKLFSAFVIILIIGGCTITVVHKFDDPLVQYIVSRDKIDMESLDSLETMINPAPTGKEGAITFINDPDTEENIIIEKIRKDQTISKVVGRLYTDATGRSITLMAEIGDRFIFKVEGAPDFKIESYVVEKFGETHTLKVAIRYKDARNKYARIDNAQASRTSYDIFYILPEAIEKPRSSGGGAMKQVFEDLKDDDVDWRPYDGDYALKNQFNLNVKDVGEGKIETKRSYGLSNFKESFSFNIGLSIGIPGVGSLSRSLGFDKSSETQESHEKVYTFGRKDQTVYDIDLVKQKAVLTSDFRSAVIGLPLPLSMVQDTNQAKLDPAYHAFQNFIQEWGTHYPTRVSYGGFIIVYKVFTMERLIEGEELGINYSEEVTASIKGVELGRTTDASYKEGERFEKQESTHTEGFMYKGGQGDDNNWNVGDRVQPTHIHLERLDDLISIQYFRNGISENELKLKQNMLSMALSAYIKAYSDSGTSLRPRVFSIETKSIKNNKDRVKLYGKAEISLYKNNKWTSGKTFFNYDYDNKGQYLELQKFQSTDKFPSSIKTIVYPENGGFNLAPYQYKIYGDLWDQWDAASDDRLIVNSAYMPFSKIAESNLPKEFSLFVKSKDYDVEIQIITEVKELSLSGYGFP